MVSSDSELLGRSSSYKVNSMSLEGPTCCERLKNRMDSFREYLATTCCACLASIPSFAFVVLAVVLVMLLIASIPLAFAFTYMNTDANAADVPNTSVRVFRDHDYWSEGRDELSNSTMVRSSLLLPPNVTACKGFGFACTNEPSHVIGTYKRCDGVKDCPDGSDELDCHTCQTTLSCLQKGNSERKICLRGSNLCDGIQQCSDGADEKAYCRETCPDGLKKCKDANICLTDNMICDGDKHCPNGDDEENCSQCKNGAKLCEPTKTCIPKWQLCDGRMDCEDGSDELDCDCKACSGTGLALCDGDKKMCIDMKDICDGKAHCPAGEDEEQCPGSCIIDFGSRNETSDDASTSAMDKNKFKNITCGGKSYNWRYGCGGFVKACDGLCEECNLGTSFDCNLESNSTSKVAKCIHRSNVCNGKNDCGNNADEENCDCAKRGMLMCSALGYDGKQKCYASTKKCDGYNDCPDGEDEKNCDGCSNGAFFCKKDRKCVIQIKRCDGVDDCSDGEDEENCSCEDCQAHPFKMYMCSSGSRCYRVNNVCNPYSRCPDADARDKLYCAVSQGGGQSYL